MRYDRGYIIVENINILAYSISLWMGILENITGVRMIS
jgi:hypothetical protein